MAQVAQQPAVVDAADDPWDRPRADPWTLRRPVVGLAVFLAVGIGGGLLLPGAPVSLFAATLTLWLLALRFRRHVWSSFLLAAVLGGAGWLHAALQVHSPSARELGALLERPAEHVAVIGVICDEPTVRTNAPGDVRNWSFPLRVEGVQRVRAWQRATGVVSCQLRRAPAGRTLNYGERWLLEGSLSARPRGFDPATALPGYLLSAEDAGARRLGTGQGSALYAWCLRKRQTCSGLLGRGIETYPAQVGLLRAMLLGSREEIPDAIYRDFSVTGTLHVIAISGTHVAVMALLLVTALKSAGVTQPHWVFFLAPLLTLYTLGTGLAASAVRACLMAILFWAAPLLRRRPDGLTALAWAGVLIVAWAPEQLFDPGFVFSFVAVLGLMLLCPPLLRRFNQVLRDEPWRLQPEPWWPRQGRAAARRVLLLLISSLAACLATAPLTAHYFNLLSPVTLLANLAIIPAAFIMMVIGCLTLVLGGLSNFCAEVFNHANRLVISFMMESVEVGARVPGGHFFVRSPSWLLLACFYAGLAVWMLAGRRVRRVVEVGAAAGLLAGVAWYAADRRIEATIWRPGGALVAFVNVPGMDDILVDTGPRFKAREVIRQLHREGVDRLRALVLTHHDPRQVGGATNVLDQIPTRELWYPAALTNQPAFTKFLSEVRTCAPRVTCRPLAAGDRLPLSGGATWEVLHPAADFRARRADDRSLVFRLVRGPSALLFMGQAGALVENLLLQQPGRPAAAALLVLNHAAMPSAAWLQAVAPRDVILPMDEVGAQTDNARRLAGQERQVWPLPDEGALQVRWPEAAGDSAALLIKACP